MKKTENTQKTSKSWIQHLVIVLKGMWIGGTMTVPGVSGGSMAILLGIYDKLIFAISKFTKNIKANILFLVEFVLGAGVGLVLFSRFIMMLLERFEMPTSYFFLGAVAGGIPLIIKEAKITKNDFISKKTGKFGAYTAGKVLLYLVFAGIGILIVNWSSVPEAFALIFKSAFTPMAGVGGFAGATARDAIRYGIARGLYSNDAGTGYGIIAHASARTDHPVRQSSWGWGEVFTTLIVCTVTGLSIVLTNVYIDYPEVDSSALTTVAFEVAYGPIGGGFLAAAITIFAWTTIIGMYYSCAKSVNYAFGDTLANRRASKVYMVYYMIPCVFFYNIQADALWAMTDLLSAAYVAITLLFIFTQQKEIFRLFRDFWDRYIPARERGENPPPVTFGTIDEKAEKESV